MLNQLTPLPACLLHEDKTWPYRLTAEIVTIFILPPKALHKAVGSLNCSSVLVRRNGWIVLTLKLLNFAAAHEALEKASSLRS